MKKLLVIGCARSGTRYTSKVFRSLGLDIRHEKNGKDGTVNWASVAIENDLKSHDIILHQVREPIASISSIHILRKFAFKYSVSVEPKILEGKTNLQRNMRYWLFWNRLCSEKSMLTYRVEDLTKRIKEFMDLIGKEITEKDIVNICKISTQDHSCKNWPTYKAITLNDLLKEDEYIAEEIKKDAEKYGYKL